MRLVACAPFALLAVSCGGRAITASPALEGGVAADAGGGGGDGGGKPAEGGAEGGDCWSRCPGGECDGDECIVTLARGSSMKGIAVDSANVYFVESTTGAPAEAAVVRVPLAGGSAVTLAQVGDAQSGDTIAVDAHDVYWAATTDRTVTGAIMRVPIVGGTNATLASTQGVPVGLALAGPNLYFTVLGTAADQWNDGAVLQVPIAGGVTTTLASGQTQASSLMTDGQDVYWTTWGSVMKMPLAGGGPVPLASGTGGSWGMALDGGYVYFEDVQTEQNILRVPIGGGTSSTFATHAVPSGIAVDGTNLYWVEGGSQSLYVHGAVVRMPLSGGMPVTLEVLSTTQPRSPIAVDATSVYWTDGMALYRATPK